MSALYLFYSLRPRQWIKNLFVFMPLVFGQKLFSAPENFRVAAGFVLFCMAASAVYLINDLVDLKGDQLHRTKRLRPIASGRVPPRSAKAAAIVLAAASLAAGALLSLEFAVVLAGYLLFNAAYTAYIKRIVILDVFCLSLFFILRIVGGTVLSGVDYSHWMLFLIALLALFLGFSKRRQELRSHRPTAAEQRSVLSKYNLYFIDQMIGVLTASIVVVYMLYTVDAKTVQFMGSNRLIWSIPFVYYGIFRYLYLVHKRSAGEDPTAVVYSDLMMKINLILWMAVCVAAIYYGP